MLETATILLGLSVLSADIAPMETSLEGRWEGQVLVDPGRMEVDFVLTVSGSEPGSASIWFPTQGPTEQKVTILGLLNGAVAFETIDVNGVVDNFSGEMTADGSGVEGTLAESGTSQRFSMRRVSSETQAWPKSRQVEALSSDLKPLQAEFNRNRDKVRILMVLAPSCGLCRMAARMVERYFDGQPGEQTAGQYVTLIAWEKVSDKDTEESAREAAASRHGTDARQFWLTAPTLGELLREPLNIKDALIWDVVLVFAPGAVWEDSFPQPALFQHNRKNAAFPPERLFNAPVLVEETRTLLGRTDR